MTEPKKPRKPREDIVLTEFTPDDIVRGPQILRIIAGCIAPPGYRGGAPNPDTPHGRLRLCALILEGRPMRPGFNYPSTPKWAREAAKARLVVKERISRASDRFDVRVRRKLKMSDEDEAARRRLIDAGLYKKTVEIDEPE